MLIHFLRGMNIGLGIWCSKTCFLDFLTLKLHKFIMRPRDVIQYMAQDTGWCLCRPIRGGLEEVQFENMLTPLEIRPFRHLIWVGIQIQSPMFQPLHRVHFEETNWWILLISNELSIWWNKALPIKVYISIHGGYFWTASPPIVTLMVVELISIQRCPVCDDGFETNQNLFVDCSIANNLWKMVYKWVGSRKPSFRFTKTN